MTTGNRFLGRHTLPPHAANSANLQKQREAAQEAMRGSHALACALLATFEAIAARNHQSLPEAMHSQLSGVA